MSDRCFLSITFLWSNARFSVKSLHLALKFSIFALGLHCACQSFNLQAKAVKVKRIKRVFSKIYYLKNCVKALTVVSYHIQYYKLWIPIHKLS